MKRQNSRNSGYIGSSLMILILLSGVIFGQASFGALARPGAGDIPLKSLIVGTYIIDFAAVSPTNIETAIKTVEASGQDQMYYRSELTTGGLWINITNGSGIKDILDTSETVVQNAEINSLTLTHWIKNDGAVYELGSGNKKTFSQLNPLVNPLVMDGMAPLDTERDKQIEILKNLDDEDDGYGTAVNKKAILDTVLAPLNAGALQSLDASVDAIEASAAALRQNKNVDASAIHAVDDTLKEKTIERELAYLKAELKKLTDAGERAGTLDYGTLSDQIWTAHGKLGEKIRALEAESSGGEPATPLEAVAQSAGEKLADAAETGNLDAILAAAEDKALSDQLALGLPVKSEEAKAILEKALEDTKNEAVLAALKGTSFAYEAGKKNGEGPAVLAEMLDQETEDVKTSLDNWKDLVDMLADASDDDADKTAILSEYSEALTALMGALPETDMKPKLTSALADALSESQGEVSASNAENNPVLQALLNNKEQQEAQLALINEAYADALENGDLAGAEEISDLADQLIASTEAASEAALDNYFDAKAALDDAQKKVDAILAGSKSDDGSDAGDSSEDSSGDSGGQGSSDQTGGESGSADDGSDSGDTGDDTGSQEDVDDGEDTDQDLEDDQDSVDTVALTDAIHELGQARDALEEAKVLLSPEDLQVIEAFLDLASAVEVYAEQGNGEMAKSSAEALEDMLAVLPQGMDVQSILEDMVDALNQAKAQAALEGDISGAQGLAQAQLMMKEASLGEFADSQLSKDTSVTDVLTGTVIIKPDGYMSSGITYIGIKSLFDQIGGQTVWNPEKQMALGIANRTSIEITVGSRNAIIAEEEIPMEGPAQLKDGRAYLPFNTVSQYMNQFLDERFDGLRVIILPHLIGE